MVLKPANLALIYTLFTLAIAGCTSAKKAAPVSDLDINEPTRLIEQAARGNEADVKALLVAGEKPDQANSQGVTALMVAARKGQLAVMQLLLSAHANVALADEQGSTALHYAILGNQTKAVELLLQNHAPIDKKDGFDLTPLMLATRFADVALIKTLIRGKANLSIVDENGWTAIFFAVGRGDADIFEIYADAVEDLNLKDNDGDSLAMVAIQYKQPNMLKKLIELHAPIDTPNKRGVTPLRLAIENGDTACVQALAKVVSINEKLPDGRSPLMFAIDLRQKEVAGLLLSLKPDLSAKDTHGRTYMDHLTALGLDPDWLASRTSTL